MTKITANEQASSKHRPTRGGPKIAWSARSPRSEDLKDGCAARDLNPEPAD